MKHSFLISTIAVCAGRKKRSAEKGMTVEMTIEIPLKYALPIVIFPEDGSAVNITFAGM